MTVVREPVAAGRFYPASAEQLAQQVDGLLAGAMPGAPAGELRALVAPHAGYVYSGATAAAAFAALPPGVPRRVVLLGPSHFVPVRGAAVSGAEVWRTPLGDTTVDVDLRRSAVHAGAAVDDGPHLLDHALEVELPFMQRRMGSGLQVLPIAVGPGETPGLLAALGEEALLVVSTDLSHYHDDETARRLDGHTVDAVLRLDTAALSDRAACGVHALRMLLTHARARCWRATLLDVRTSAAATGDLASVVGYAAFAFTS